MNQQSKAEIVFFAALEHTQSEKRAAYLSQACAGDVALRTRIEALLAAHSRVGQFLEHPVVEAEVVTALDGLIGVTSDLSYLDSPTEPDSIGRLDHYEVLGLVGQGGTGVVLRARDTKLQRVVAIKVLNASLATSREARRRFVREARAAAAVRDPHVIDIYAVCDEGPVPYMVMEYVDGCTLEALIRERGPLDVSEVLRIGIQVATGLAAAHKQGLIHRDIKPANTLLENGVQRVKLTDFGLARAADDASLTQSGFIAGTPAYMSPEQINGDPIDHRSDQFSLGSMLYEMTTGRAPFRAPNTAALLRRIVDEAPEPIHEINPEVPDSLNRLIERLHAKNPADRPASATEIAESLGRMLAEVQARGATGQPAPERRLSGPRRKVPIRRWLWAAAALVVFAGLGVGEATGVTQVRGTVIRLFFPEGTLVVEIDEPGVSVDVEGADVVITGAGVKEIRLRPGRYKVAAQRDGKVVHREVVTVSHAGRQVVRISEEVEPMAEAQAWEESVAKLAPEKQVEAVAGRLKQLNPGFDGTLASTRPEAVVTGLRLNSDAVTDLAPLRALKHLEMLHCSGTIEGRGILADLSPLRGMPLSVLHLEYNPVSDLSPLEGMPLKELGLFGTKVADLTPLRGMPLVSVGVGKTRITDLSPLKGMKLTHLYCDLTPVHDLSPLEGMPLEALLVPSTRVSDLSPLRGMPLGELAVDHTLVADLSILQGMPLKVIRCNFQNERDAEVLRSLTTLERINGKTAEEFWKHPEGK